MASTNPLSRHHRHLGSSRRLNDNYEIENTDVLEP